MRFVPADCAAERGHISQRARKPSLAAYAPGVEMCVRCAIRMTLRESARTICGLPLTWADRRGANNDRHQMGSELDLRTVAVAIARVLARNQGIVILFVLTMLTEEPGAVMRRTS
jgi:hypothetical protein